MFDNVAKPLILVSNDDGITSKGIRALVQAMQTIGEVVLVAPNSPQSGIGHAITIRDTLKLEKSNVFKHIQAFECSGTPADCIKIAKKHVLKNRKPNLVVSGINHGSNSSISVLYSGTMAAAMEAAIGGIPAIGFSLCDYAPDANFSHTIPHIIKIAKQTIKRGLPNGIALNVNFPPIQKKTIKGIKVCKQANAKWQEEFDERYDPYGNKYFWMTGEFINVDKKTDNDQNAIDNNYVSIVPCQYDLSSKSAIETISKEWKL